MQAAVIIMSRAPIPGKTKTRLSSHLKAEESAQLHQAFLKDINNKLLNLKRKEPGFSLYLSYTPENKVYLFDDLISKKFIRVPQRGKNLGEKMYNALKDVSIKSKSPVIISGSDLPLLNVEIFIEAAAALKERDLVIGPTQDGGYYLIAVNEVKKYLFDFSGWGKSSVLEKTLKKASQNDLKVHFLPEVADVDNFKELLQLRAELKNKEKDADYPGFTQKAIESILNY